ncbi:MAG: sugar phosphate nucleotidyltransferase [Candidatus Woesearchaeota archaeon]
MNIIPVILAGGKGERFWPLSREKRPKQSLALTSEKALIHETYDRLKEFSDFCIVANKNLCNSFKTILPSSVKYIEEPMGRDTCAAIGYAAAYLSNMYQDCVMIIEPADSYHKDLITYNADMKKACDFATHQNVIVLMGIKPTHPHTGLGYIKTGIHLFENINTVDKFVEKPNLALAKKYVNDETFLWNSGKFIAKASVVLLEIQEHMPKLYQQLMKIKESNFDEKIVFELFPQMEKKSFDIGVLEKSRKAAVLTSTMDWDDVGDFNAITRIQKPDEAGNYIKGLSKTIESKGNIVVSEKLVALIGVEDLLIVDTPDALLVCRKDRSQDIKKLVQELDEKYK